VPVDGGAGNAEGFGDLGGALALGVPCALAAASASAFMILGRRTTESVTNRAQLGTCGNCDERDNRQRLSRFVDWLRHCLFPDLPAAGNPWRGRRTLTSVGPVAVLLLLEDRRDDCPHRPC
jgi:hypothetical protein